jgi:hypothetical protein
MMPIDLWIYDNIKQTGFWMYHGINYGTGPTSYLIVTIKQSLIIQKLKESLDLYWLNNEDTENTLNLDTLFMNICNTDSEFALEWSKVPYIWSESIGQSNMLVGLCDDINSNLEYIIKYNPPYVLNLSTCSNTTIDIVINSMLSQANSPYPLHNTDYINYVKKLNNTVVIIADYGNKDELIVLDNLCKKKNIQIIVYDKYNFCPHINNNIICRPLLNIGRDMGTFLYFVKEYYDNLPNEIFFLPGNINKHNRLKRFIKIIETKNCGIFEKLQKHATFTLDAYETVNLEPSRIRPFKNWVEKFIEPWNDDNDGPRWNGVMYTCKERILKHPKILYINLLNELKSNNTEVVHYIERIMASIF